MGSQVEVEVEVAKKEKENPRESEKKIANGNTPNEEYSHPAQPDLPNSDQLSHLSKDQNIRIATDAAAASGMDPAKAVAVGKGAGEENDAVSSPRKLEEKIDHNIVSAANHANGAVANKIQNNYDDENNNTIPKMDANGKGHARIVQPHSNLPKPEAPPGILNSKNDDVQSNFSVGAVDMPSIGKFIRQRSNGLSAAIAKRISSFKESIGDQQPNREVTEFNLSDLKVIVRLKTSGDEQQQMKGRISFFSRSNCRDCTAVRRFLRERGLKFVEINIDVYPEREKELIERTGTASVPQIFLNEKLFGGLVALNSLRNSGGLEQRWTGALSVKCPDNAPAPPLYGFDYQEEDRTDEMVGIVRVLRQRLPIQDRLMKMKIIKNCFAGNELVEVVIHHLDCGRRKAVEIGKQLSKKHFIHHVFGENDFEEGNHFYRFLEHDPFISKCFNFCGVTNDSAPKPAAAICQRLTKIMFAILESYASNDKQHVDYFAISRSEEFRRYVNMTQDLQRVNPSELSENEKLAFFLNLYNAMVIHAIIRLGCPEDIIDRRSFFSSFQYVIGGHPFSLTNIKNGILRSNRRPPYTLVKPFGTGDRRLELALVKMNPLVHFGICQGTKSSPKVRFFSPQGVVDELRCAAREFFENGGIEVDLEKRTVHLTRIIKWFNVDFGQDKDLLKWILNYLDATKAGLLTHLLGDGGPVNISYQNFDWSINS